MNLFSRIGEARKPNHLKWNHSFYSDKGNIRTCNEDRIAFHTISQAKGPLALALVADGMGGHSHGDVAAETARNEITRVVLSSPNYKSPKRLLRSAFRSANMAIRELSKKRPNLSTMGTTCTAALFEQSRITVAHVGDCRLYLLGKEIHQITTDHTLVQNLLLAGEISANEALAHPERNIITRALGTGPAVHVDFYSISPAADSRYLICSDGLYEYLTPGEMADILDRDGCEVGPRTMTELAKDRGGHDNISVVVVTPTQTTRNKPLQITQEIVLP